MSFANNCPQFNQLEMALALHLRAERRIAETEDDIEGAERF